MICWYCGCEFGKNTPKCPECGHTNRIGGWLAAGMGISACLVVCQPAENPHGGTILLGVLGLVGCGVYGLFRAVRAAKLHKQWVGRRQNEIRRTEFIVPAGKNTQPPINFDIVPDRVVDIEYRDARKQITRRTITAMRIKEEHTGGLYLVGLCHLRRRMRSFRYDRIVSITENGATRTGAQWLCDIGFDNFRAGREQVAVEKLRKMVRNMDDGALAEFVKNTD